MPGLFAPGDGSNGLSLDVVPFGRRKAEQICSIMIYYFVSCVHEPINLPRAIGRHPNEALIVSTPV